MGTEKQEEIRDNGHEPVELVEGPGIVLDDLKKVDGLIGKRVAQNIGVLVRAMTAHPIEEVQQELKIANFGSTDEADEFVSAYFECKTLGMDPAPIYAQMLARTAGIKQSHENRILDAITHTTFTSNYQKGDKNFAKNRSNNPFST